MLHTGNGPRPEQDGAHVHFAAESPDFQRCAVAVLCKVTSLTTTIRVAGKLCDPVFFHAVPGLCPRHMSFNHNNPVSYYLWELSSQVSILS